MTKTKSNIEDYTQCRFNKAVGDGSLVQKLDNSLEKISALGSTIDSNKINTAIDKIKTVKDVAVKNTESGLDKVSDLPNQKELSELMDNQDPNLFVKDHAFE